MKLQKHWMLHFPWYKSVWYNTTLLSADIHWHHWQECFSLLRFNGGTLNRLLEVRRWYSLFMQGVVRDTVSKSEHASLVSSLKGVCQRLAHNLSHWFHNNRCKCYWTKIIVLFRIVLDCQERVNALEKDFKTRALLESGPRDFHELVRWKMHLALSTVMTILSALMGVMVLFRSAHFSGLLAESKQKKRLRSFANTSSWMMMKHFPIGPVKACFKLFSTLRGTRSWLLSSGLLVFSFIWKSIFWLLMYSKLNAPCCNTRFLLQICSLQVQAQII